MRANSGGTAAESKAILHILGNDKLSPIERKCLNLKHRALALKAKFLITRIEEGEEAARVKAARKRTRRGVS